MINDYILNKLDGNVFHLFLITILKFWILFIYYNKHDFYLCEEKIYFSAYNIDSTDKKSVNDEALGPSFLNSIKVYGLPNHSLRLKISCHVQRRTHVRGWGVT